MPLAVATKLFTHLLPSWGFCLPFAFCLACDCDFYFYLSSCCDFYSSFVFPTAISSHFSAECHNLL